MEYELPPESQAVADGEPLSPRPRLSRRPNNEDAVTLDQEHDSGPPPEGPPPDSPPPPTAEHKPEPESEAWSYRLQFTGTASEYFRIWIVNLFLTVITFGIYAAWARVRTRKYMYSNTWLGEDSFGYHGPATAILKGNIIVAVGFFAYMFSGYLHPYLPIMVLIVFFFVFPLIIWKAIGFKARYSSLRNIRFRFDGSVNDAYINFLWAYLMMPFTLGFILPFIKFLQKRYFINNMHFGDQDFQFRGDSGGFYIPYLILWGVVIGLGVAFAVLSVLVGIIISALPSLPEESFLLIGVLIYVGFILTQTVLPMLTYAMIQKYSFENTILGSDIYFKCHYSAPQLMWIRFSNIAAIIFSLGLLIPWAAVRRAKYLTENIEVIVEGDILDQIQSRYAEDESALGDSAVDAFDFEIGL